MDKDEALDLALEALEESHPEAYRQVITALRTAIEQADKQEPVSLTYKEVTDTMNILRRGTLEQQQAAALMENKKLYTTPPAQPAPVQEPVGWFGYSPAHDAWFHTNEGDDDSIPLYKAPPAAKRRWVKLTDEEIIQIALETPIGGTNFARAIEAELREKNGGQA